MNIVYVYLKFIIEKNINDDLRHAFSLTELEAGLVEDVAGPQTWASSSDHPSATPWCSG